MPKNNLTMSRLSIDNDNSNTVYFTLSRGNDEKGKNMAGFHDSVKAMTSNYANGTLAIERNDGKLTFSGKTYECKSIIKDLADGKAKWNGVNKAWTINESDIRDINWNLLSEITNGEIAK